jgi:hypothetical protein
VSRTYQKKTAATSSEAVVPPVEAAIFDAKQITGAGQGVGETRHGLTQPISKFRSWASSARRTCSRNWFG